MTNILLAILIFGSFFLESIFGFGGTVIFLGVGVFLLDFKTLIYIAMFMNLPANITMLAQSWRQIQWRHFFRIALLIIPGLVIGTYLIDVLATPVLLKTFALFLVLYGLMGIVFPNIKLPKAIGTVFVAAGGLIQGLFTTGGPFVLMGYRDNFDHRTHLRATMAMFFLCTNLYRVTQKAITQPEQLVEALHYWWVIIPIVLGVMAGYKIHLQIPEDWFKKAMTWGLTAIGLLLLFR